VNNKDLIPFWVVNLIQATFVKVIGISPFINDFLKLSPLIKEVSDGKFTTQRTYLN